MSGEDGRVEDFEAMLERLRVLEARVTELESRPSPRPTHAPTFVTPATPQAEDARFQPPPPTGPMSPPPPSSGPSLVAPPRAELTTDVLLKWAGLGLLFLAAVFLVGTAISRGWIGPRLQLTGAALGGLALIGTGLKLRPRPGWTSPLVGVGVSILFVCAGAAWSWLDLGSPEFSVAVGLGVALGAVVLARYLDDWTIGLVALVGLIWVPTWVGFNDNAGLAWSFAYLFVVVGLFTSVYLERHWSLLWVMSVLASALLILGDAQNTIRSDEPIAETVVRTALVFAFALIYWFAPVVSARVGKQSLMSQEFRVALFVPVWFWSAAVNFDEMGDSAVAIAGGVVACAAALSAVLTREIVGKAFFLTQCLGASVMVSVSLVYLVDGPILLLAFALQTAVLIGLVRLVDDLLFTVQAALSAAIVSFVTTVWILTALYQDLDTSDDAINLVVIGLLVVLSALEIKRASANPPTSRTSVGVGEVGLLVAYVAFIWWIPGVLIHLSQGQALITSAWSALAVAVVTAAILLRSNPILRLGLATLALVVCKLLTVDLAEVDVFVRVALFFVIGLGLLALSYRLPRLMGSAEDKSTIES